MGPRERQESHQLFATPQKEPKKEDATEVATIPKVTEFEDDELPAGIEGAQFFGGNKEKEEFYDPEAEALAGLDLKEASKVNQYQRFQDRTAFDNEETARIAQDLQS